MGGKKPSSRLFISLVHCYWTVNSRVRPFQPTAKCMFNLVLGPIQDVGVISVQLVRKE